MKSASKLEDVEVTAAGLTDAQVAELASVYEVVAADERKPMWVRRWYYGLARQLRSVESWRSATYG